MESISDDTWQIDAGSELSHDGAEVSDVLIIGAGPTGLQAACTAQDLGLTHRVIDRFGLAHSFVGYPQALRFFSPPDEMEIGGLPFPIRGGEKPAREDILPYFRAVAAYKKLNLSLWERIIDLRREDSVFVARTMFQPNGEVMREYKARSLVLASGIWEQAVTLKCPGATLPHVSYRFNEPTEYFGMDVLVVGGGNSAVHAALMLSEAHANVTLAMRRDPQPYQSHLRPFVVRDLKFAVDEGKVRLNTNVVVKLIEPGHALLQPAVYDPESAEGGEELGDAFSVSARFVFCLLGQQPDKRLLEDLGLVLYPDGRPVCDRTTFETSVPGAYAAGSLAGNDIDIIVKGRVQTAEVIRTIAKTLR